MAFWEGYIVTEDVRERGVAVLALEGCGTVQHFVDQDTKGPPVYCTSVTASLDNFRRYVLFSSYERICPEVRNT